MNSTIQSSSLVRGVLPWIAVACVSLEVLLPCAEAAGWPEKPIRFVVGASPDVLPRLVGQKLADVWGQQIVVDQRPGAGGIIAAELVAKAPADGYTWLLSTGAYTTLSGLYPRLPYDFVRDLAPVTLMATIPFALVVHPSVAANSVQDFIKLARSRPGQLNYGSGGNGTTSHLAGEMFKSMAKVEIVHVPYKGVPAAVIDLIGGQVQMMFAVMQSALPHVKAGRLRALAVTSARRTSSAPDLPTIAESGVPGYEFISWNAVHVPAGTTKPVTRTIRDEIVKVLALPDVKERMFGLGLETASSTPEQLGELVRSDIAKWSKVIKEAGVKAD
ncbi:MAG TPA: tripartite tricarboxylate transporter substrate binding protein [Burkholderiales bacterium]|nr:tripartite tricarboxylate transporter substrate binding protein [Burkholderiales bacterium]